MIYHRRSQASVAPAGIGFIRKGVRIFPTDVGSRDNATDVVRVSMAAAHGIHDGAHHSPVGCCCLCCHGGIGFKVVRFPVNLQVSQSTHSS
jgi:hypothetical protein